MRVGKLSGAVGTYANCDPRVEEFALSALGLEREDVATQVIPRDRHATLLAAIAVTGSSLDRFATEVRHLQRTEVREALEPFAAGQKGSSAMPHKQNPIVSERISGLARVLRANAQVGLRGRRRCGTSATSRTPPPSASSCRTRRSRWTTCSTGSPG